MESWRYVLPPQPAGARGLISRCARSDQSESSSPDQCASAGGNDVNAPAGSNTAAPDQFEWALTNRLFRADSYERHSSAGRWSFQIREDFTHARQSDSQSEPGLF